MKSFTLALFLMLALTVPSASAGSRRFTYVYEVTTSPPGDIESENWITWKTRKPDDHSFDQVEFRHELEFGITEKFQLSVYFADWDYHRGVSVGESGFTLQGGAVEMIYNLSNPVADPIGLALYQEFNGGYHFFESESKFLAQKNLGKFVVAYNATLEAEWEGEGLEERTGEFQQSFGVSYEINPRLLVGAEFVHELEFPNWSSPEPGRFFAGPDISFRHHTWWVTLTALRQVTRAEGEPDLQVRTIFGFSF